MLQFSPLLSSHCVAPRKEMSRASCNCKFACSRYEKTLCMHRISLSFFMTQKENQYILISVSNRGSRSTLSCRLHLLRPFLAPKYQSTCSTNKSRNTRTVKRKATTGRGGKGERRWKERSELKCILVR